MIGDKRLRVSHIIPIVLNLYLKNILIMPRPDQKTIEEVKKGLIRNENKHNDREKETDKKARHLQLMKS